MFSPNDDILSSSHKNQGVKMGYFWVIFSSMLLPSALTSAWGTSQDPRPDRRRVFDFACAGDAHSLDSFVASGFAVAKGFGPNKPVTVILNQLKFADSESIFAINFFGSSEASDDSVTVRGVPSTLNGTRFGIASAYFDLAMAQGVSGPAAITAINGTEYRAHCRMNANPDLER